MGLQDTDYVRCKEKHDDGFWSAVAEKRYANPSAVKNVFWQDSMTGTYCLLRPIVRLPGSAASKSDY